MYTHANLETQLNINKQIHCCTSEDIVMLNFPNYHYFPIFYISNSNYSLIQGQAWVLVRIL